jgi:excisionase family DNA binding protein
MKSPFRDLTTLDELLTRAQVAALLSVSPSTVTRWADEGRLTCVRTLGGHRRYQKRDIIQIMSEVQREIEEGPHVAEDKTMEEFQVEIPKLFGDHHATAVQQALAQVPGIEQVWVSPARHLVKVRYDPDKVDVDTIVHRLGRAGFPIRNGHDDPSDHHRDPAWSKLDLRMTQTYRNGA